MTNLSGSKPPKGWILLPLTAISICLRNRFSKDICLFQLGFPGNVTHRSIASGKYMTDVFPFFRGLPFKITMFLSISALPKMHQPKQQPFCSHPFFQCRRDLRHRGSGFRRPSSICSMHTCAPWERVCHPSQTDHLPRSR